MSEFWTLVGFEYKKLFKRRMVWITLAVMLTLTVFSAVAPLIGGVHVDGQRVEGTWEMNERDMAYAKALSGTPLNEENLKKVREAYKQLPEGTVFVSAVEVFDKYAAPYQELWNMAVQMSPTSEGRDNIYLPAEKLYEMRRAYQEASWERDYFTEGEKEELRARDAQVQKPFVYEYSESWKNIMDMFLTLGVMQVLAVSVCVPMIFSEEHSRKTRALILCTPRGKKMLYKAKAFTACSFSIAVTLALIVVAAVPTFFIYGAEGFGAQIQNHDPLAPWSLRVGQAVLIMVGISVAAALIHGAFLAVLAEKTRSALIPMALLVGLLIAGQVVNIPAYLRVLSKLWSGLPTNMVAYWNVFSDYLYSLFGHYFTTWQVIPAVYVLAGAAMLWIGGKIYRRADK